MYDRVSDGAAWLSNIHESIRAHEALVGGLAVRPTDQWTVSEQEAVTTSRNRIVFLATDSPIHTEGLDAKTITIALLAYLAQQLKGEQGMIETSELLFAALRVVQRDGESRHTKEPTKAPDTP